MHWLIAATARLWFRWYGRWQVIGLENVPKTGGVVIAANHVSYVDPVMGWAAIGRVRQMWGLAKSELWRNPVSAYLMVCIGTLPVRRGTADRAMLRKALELLAKGEAVGLFPEGARSPDGKLQPGQPGLALIVQKSGVPVVPVGLLGTYEMLPRNRKKFKRTRLKVVFGEPMTFASDTPRDQITNRVMTAIAALLSAHGQPTDPPPPVSSAARHSPTASNV